jgi:hypothetical protein
MLVDNLSYHKLLKPLQLKPKQLRAARLRQIRIRFVFLGADCAKRMDEPLYSKAHAYKDFGHDHHHNCYAYIARHPG